MSSDADTPYRALLLDDFEAYEELIEELTAFIDAGGRIGVALHNRAVAQWEIGRIDEALAGLEQAIGALPTIAMPNRVQGMILHWIGRLPEALAALDRALSIEPEDVTLWRKRAEIRADAGLLAEAIADLDCAMRLQPTFKHSIAERARLQALLAR